MWTCCTSQFKLILITFALEEEVEETLEIKFSTLNLMFKM